MSATYKTWLGMVEDLVRAGIPRPSPWWEGTIKRFYESGARALVAEVGRGGAKSFNGVLLALNELLFGHWPVPPGERHWFIIGSCRVEEAAPRATQAQHYLHALGAEHDRAGNSITLRDLPVGLLIVPSTIAGASGPRGIGWLLDEAQKHGDSPASPLADVASSLRATTVQHPAAHEIALSSVHGHSQNWHAKLVAEGDTPRQIVARAPTWIAAPWISEEMTRDLEADPVTWRQEYANERGQDASNAFDEADIRRCIGAVHPVGTYGQPVLVIDASTGRGDAFVGALVQWCRPATSNPEAAPPSILVVHAMRAWTGKFGTDIHLSAIVAELAAMAREAGAVTAHGDQLEAWSLEGYFADAGIRFIKHAWTGGATSNKASAVVRLRRHLGEGTIALPNDDKLAKELCVYRESAGKTGSTFAARTGHDDRVSVLVTAMLADAAGWIASSPIERSRELATRVSVFRKGETAEGAPVETRPGHPGYRYPETIGMGWQEHSNLPPLPPPAPATSSPPAAPLTPSDQRLLARRRREGRGGWRF